MVDLPIGYWRFDETTSAMPAKDEASRHDGIYQGGVKLGGSGAMCGGTSASLDGVSGFVEFGDVFSFVGTAPFSVELWVCPSVVDVDWKGLITKEVGGNGWDLFLQSDPGTGLGFERWLDGTVSLATTAPPPIGLWTHVVQTFDGSTLKLYVNAELAGAGVSPLGLIDNTSHLVVGARFGGTGHFVTAEIDEVALYDHGLSADNIALHYAAATKP